MWSNDVGFIKIPTAESTNPFWFLMFIPKAKELLVPPAGASVSLRLPAGAHQCLTTKLRSTSDEPAGSHTRCPEDFLLGFALQSLQLLRIQQLLRRKKAKNTQVLAPGLEFKSVTGWCPGPGPQGPGCLLTVTFHCPPTALTWVTHFWWVSLGRNRILQTNHYRQLQPPLVKYLPLLFPRFEVWLSQGSCPQVLPSPDLWGRSSGEAAPNDSNPNGHAGKDRRGSSARTDSICASGYSNIKGHI